MQQRPKLALLRCLVLATSTALLCAATAFAQNTSQTNPAERLGELRKSIDSVRRDLDVFSGKQKRQRRELRKAEQAVAENRQLIATSKRALRQQRQAIDALVKQNAELDAKKVEQKARVADAIRDAWSQGSQNRVKLLLNQEDPAAVARLMTYYEYLTAARKKHIDDYIATIDELKISQAKLADARAAVKVKLAQQTQLQKKLEQSLKQRALAMGKLETNIKTKRTQLSDLQRERKQMQALLEEISKRLEGMDPAADKQPFNQRKGKMRWPVKGKIVRSFGKVDAVSRLATQGVTLSTTQGEPVRAIHLGRVVYADWFQGRGLMMIVSHGKNYLSIYAHNQSLMREVGDWVGTGEVIAAAGQSGGLKSPALYFEIRENKKPQDPVRWCK